MLGVIILIIITMIISIMGGTNHHTNRTPIIPRTIQIINPSPMPAPVVVKPVKKVSFYNIRQERHFDKNCPPAEIVNDVHDLTDNDNTMLQY